ncbi:MAG: hypothetical protein KDB21_01450 [Acidimicrobiales bacterium]|nr:hypothetical protein [Acidimicrobiales bacterium]
MAERVSVDKSFAGLWAVFGVMGLAAVACGVLAISQGVVVIGLLMTGTSAFWFLLPIWAKTMASAMVSDHGVRRGLPFSKWHAWEDIDDIDQYPSGIPFDNRIAAIGKQGEAWTLLVVPTGVWNIRWTELEMGRLIRRFKIEHQRWAAAQRRRTNRG